MTKTWSRLLRRTSPAGHLTALCGTCVARRYWDQGAGNLGKAPQRSELKLEFTTAGGVCQERGGLKAKGTAGAGIGGKAEQASEPGYEGQGIWTGKAVGTTRLLSKRRPSDLF